MKIIFLVWVFFAISTAASAQFPKGDPSSEKVEAKKQAPKSTKINLGGDEVEFSGPGEGNSFQLPEKEVVETASDGEKYKYKITKRVHISRDGKYALKIETKNTFAMEEHAGNKLTYYDIAGNVIFEKDFGLLNGVPQPITDSRVLDNGKHVLVEIHNGIGENYDQLELYNSQGEVVLSTPIGNQMSYYSQYYTPPSEKYILYAKIKPTGDVELYRCDFTELRKVSEGKGLHPTFFTENGMGYVTSGAIETEEKTPSGDNYKRVIFRYFRDDKELWKAESKHEERMGLFLSKTGKYLISV